MAEDVNLMPQIQQCQSQMRAVLEAAFPAWGPDLHLAMLLQVLAQYTAAVIRDKEILDVEDFAMAMALDLVERVRVEVLTLRRGGTTDAP
jgi:hypothetical protein